MVTGDRPGTAAGPGGVMRAVVLEEFGAPFVHRDLPVPEPGPGEVLVRVAASGVNPLDLKIRSGEAAHARVQTPFVLGIDMAGTVARVGEGVTGFRAGDEVYGMTGGVGTVPGSLAGYQVADARLLAAKPRNLSMTESAALPLAVITAWEGLVDRAQVGSGGTVLVHGGAGGVGHVAVQLAVARGAQVCATGSGAAVDLIRLAGATPIDYRATAVDEYVAPLHRRRWFRRHLRHHRRGHARRLVHGRPPLHRTGRQHPRLGHAQPGAAQLPRGELQRGFTLLPLLTGHGRRHHGEILRQAAALAEAGALRPLLHDKSFSLADVSAAHDVLPAGSAHGHVVINVTPD
jgi:NADPH:quinone reductase